MLELQNVSAGYGKTDVLFQINATFSPGTVTAILGPNGCGKSTLLKALCGILPARGNILLDKKSLLCLPQQQRARLVSYLAQSRTLPEITVEKLVLHGRFPYLSFPRHYRREDLEAARAAMDRMGISELAQLPLSRLSGGQRQKAYIAMALAQDTPVVLLDEPTNFLDIATQIQTMDQARLLAQQGKTVLIVLHDISRAMATAQQILVMEGGQILATGTPEEIFESGAIEKAFSVRLRRVPTESGWHHYCEEAKPCVTSPCASI